MWKWLCNYDIFAFLNKLKLKNGFYGEFQYTLSTITFFN